MSERGTSADQKDLFALWKQLYDANEKVWTEATSEFMEAPAFAQWQGKMLETFLAFQKAWRDSATAQLEAANIATRDDVARLGELIVQLEEKVDELADRVRLTPTQTARTSAPRKVASRKNPKRTRR